MIDDMRKTQEIEIPESIADICRTDPLGIFTYRRMDCRDTDSTAFIESNREWEKTRGDFTQDCES